MSRYSTVGWFMLQWLGASCLTGYYGIDWEFPSHEAGRAGGMS